MLRMVPLPRSASRNRGGKGRALSSPAKRGRGTARQRGGGGGRRLGIILMGRRPPPPCFAWSPSPVPLRGTGEERAAPYPPPRSGGGGPRASAVEGAAGGWGLS